MQAVIMAGGKGTRIASIANDIPKPMIPILNKPILQYEIECLRNQGIADIILVVGHLGSCIRDYFQGGSAFGVHISYYEEAEPLGTAGALAYLKDVLTEDFLLLNGDIIFDVNFERFIQFHKSKHAKATLFTHPNNHPYDSGLIVADRNQCVLQWLHKEDPRTDYKNRVNAGLHILSPSVLEAITVGQKADLDRDVLKPLIPSGTVFAYDSPEYVKDMGTPERYGAVTEDLKAGRVAAKNLKNKQRAIFLDRDGTINVYKGFLKCRNEFELIDGAASAISQFNQWGFLVIVVTNQPVIARGECTIEELDGIHQRMERLLGEQGAYVDAIFYCPHHPDKGYDGEVAELKIECACRKPKPGMLLKAAEIYNIDLKHSYMIGDDLRDILTGKSVGCFNILIQDNIKSDSAWADKQVDSLLAAANIIKKLEKIS